MSDAGGSRMPLQRKPVAGSGTMLKKPYAPSVIHVRRPHPPMLMSDPSCTVQGNFPDAPLANGLPRFPTRKAPKFELRQFHEQLQVYLPSLITAGMTCHRKQHAVHITSVPRIKENTSPLFGHVPVTPMPNWVLKVAAPPYLSSASTCGELQLPTPRRLVKAIKASPPTPTATIHRPPRYYSTKTPKADRQVLKALAFRCQFQHLCMRDITMQ